MPSPSPSHLRQHGPVGLAAVLQGLLHQAAALVALGQVPHAARHADGLDSVLGAGAGRLRGISGVSGALPRETAWC